jgi:nitronate monooxygenase
MSTTILGDLGLRLPFIAAPMAGGPSTTDLVIASARAGGLGFVAGGYKSATQLRNQLAEVRAATDTYAVNLFAPNPVPVDPDAYASYLTAIGGDADRYGVELPQAPREDADSWQDKIDVLLEHPVPVVSFTFGIPHHDVLDALRRAGSVLVQTVTCVEEARQAMDAGVDALAVQASCAGGHSATMTPDRLPSEQTLDDLLVEINDAVDLPMIAAGGLSTPAQVAQAIACGADAVMVGTALLLATQAGTSDAHRQALLGADRGATLVTRSFTGRPARALPNRFTDAHHSHAPSGYPALHFLTSPIRKAAAAATEPEDVNLWAGTGYRQVREQAVEVTMSELTRDL